MDLFEKLNTKKDSLEDLGLRIDSPGDMIDFKPRRSYTHSLQNSNRTISNSLSSFPQRVVIHGIKALTQVKMALNFLLWHLYIMQLWYYCVRYCMGEEYKITK